VTGRGRNQFMAVPLASNSAGRVEPGAPVLLFVAHAPMSAYDVTRTGERFVVMAPDPEAARGTLTVVANWKRLLDR
jgi:hypothetical protein